MLLEEYWVEENLYNDLYNVLFFFELGLFK